MALITLNYVFSVGTTIIASQTNLNNSVIYSDYNGNITDANISPTAGIEYTKLALSGSIKQSDILSTFNNNSGFGLIPSGGIIMWSGSIASIPTGWFLCNGSNGTPNLTNQFIVCANADSAGVAMSTISGSAAQSGGSVTISISNLPAHAHTVPDDFGTDGAMDTLKSSTNGKNVAHSTALTSSIGSGTAYVQPYFALAFLMKS